MITGQNHVLQACTHTLEVPTKSINATVSPSASCKSRFLRVCLFLRCCFLHYFYQHCGWDDVYNAQKKFHKLTSQLWTHDICVIYGYAGFQQGFPPSHCIGSDGARRRGTKRNEYKGQFLGPQPCGMSAATGVADCLSRPGMKPPTEITHHPKLPSAIQEVKCRSTFTTLYTLQSNTVILLTTYT